MTADSELITGIVRATHEAGQALAKRAGRTPARTMAEFRAIFDEADGAALDIIRPQLSRLRPDAAWGDELDTVVADGEQWLVDAIDGAVQYLQDLPQWSVSATLLRDGQPGRRRPAQPRPGRDLRRRRRRRRHPQRRAHRPVGQDRPVGHAVRDQPAALRRPRPRGRAPLRRVARLGPAGGGRRPQPRPHLLAGRRRGERPPGRLLGIRGRRRQPPRRRPHRPRGRRDRHRPPRPPLGRRGRLHHRRRRPNCTRPSSPPSPTTRSTPIFLERTVADPIQPALTAEGRRGWRRRSASRRLV